jgi:chemotaxis protein MotA
MKKNVVPTLGLIAGMGLIIWSILLAGNLNNFIDIPSIIITIFGSFSPLLISFPFKTLKNIPNVLKMLLSSPGNERMELVNLFAELSRKARKDGLLALEDELDKINNPFLVSGLQLVIDGVEPDSIRDILELKAETIERRHSTGQAVFLKWSELAPAFGMLGTLIGLIIMLAQLDDPSKIGAGMATALVTTFYGSLMANLVFIPIASNLKVQTEEELFTAQMIIEGVLEIQAGTNPRLLEEKLVLYLAPREQKDSKNKANKLPG